MRLLLVSSAILSLHCGSPRTTTTETGPAPATGTLAPTPITSPGARPGVRLPRTFLPTQYTARLAIDPAQPTFDGSIQITGTLASASSVIWLHGYHLTIGKAVAQKDGNEVALTVTPHGTDLLEVRAATPLAAGTWTLAFDYRGELDPVNTTGAFRQTIGEHSYVYTQLEAVYARRVFPCFDEPDNKVPWKLTLDVPKALVAVANAPQASESALDDKTKRVEFAVTKPLPTYLVAFGVGPFDVVDAGKSKRGTPIRMVTLAKRGGDTGWAAKTTAELLDLTEDWFGTPYPYEKLDMLTIPLTVGFGAMENAGLITFTETLMLHDPAKAAQGPKRSWVVVGAHEIAHQWFGNLVTPVFWDDIWLNEGFANWLEYKISAKAERSYRDELSRLDVRHDALEADALVTARQIRQPITSNDDVFNAFDRITYDKGGSVLSMFEAYLGPALFQRGVRDYLAARSWGNATSADFVAQIAKTAAAGTPAKTTAKALDVEAAFATFLDQPGAPELTVTSTCKAGKLDVTIVQQRYVPPGAAAPKAGTPWILPVCIAYGSGSERAEQCTVLDSPTTTLAITARSCPRWILPNVDGAGYYRVAYTPAHLAALRDEAWPKLAQSEKLALLFDVKSRATTGHIPLQVALSFVPKLLALDDRHSVPPAVGFVSDLWPFVPDELRGKYEHYLRTTFGPLAMKAGLTPQPGESLDTEVIRYQTLGKVGKQGREPKLVDEAVRLAETWRDLPQAVRGSVIAIAADAKPEFFDRLMRELPTELDRTRRKEIISAIASVRDVGRQQQALALILDPRRDVRELLGMLGEGFTEQNQETARGFFRANAAAIMKRLPNAETSSPLARIGAVFTSTCRAEQRDAIAAYVTKQFASLPGGARVVRQHVEEMDQCIARRKVIEPEVRAWLAGLRVPKPKP